AAAGRPRRARGVRRAVEAALDRARAEQKARRAPDRCSFCSLVIFVMEAKAKILGHPIHQMLIVFPLGLLATSLFFDIAYLIRNRGELARVAYWMIFAGVISALVAAVFGLVDWLGIPSGTRAKAIGAWHGSGNVVV